MTGGERVLIGLGALAAAGALAPWLLLATTLIDPTLVRGGAPLDVVAPVALLLGPPVGVFGGLVVVVAGAVDWIRARQAGRSPGGGTLAGIALGGTGLLGGITFYGASAVVLL